MKYKNFDSLNTRWTNNKIRLKIHKNNIYKIIRF